MSEQKESSVLFNLKELMSLEEERIQTEQAEAQHRIEEESRRKAEEATLRLVEEEARRKADEESRLKSERQEREETERRQREREASELRVRLETEAQLRTKEQERQLQHELHLKQLESQQRKGIPPLAVVAAVLIAVAGMAYGYYGVYKPEQARIAAQVVEKERLAQHQAQERQRIADALAQKERETDRLVEEKRRIEETARIRAEQQAIARKAAAATVESELGAARGRGGKSKPDKTGKDTKPDKTGKDQPKKGSDDDPLKGLDDL
jgi:colicin import membrane protein